MLLEREGRCIYTLEEKMSSTLTLCQYLHSDSLQLLIQNFHLLLLYISSGGCGQRREWVWLHDMRVCVHVIDSHVLYCV